MDQQTRTLDNELHSDLCILIGCVAGFVTGLATAATSLLWGWLP
jgi:hypothetical protein